MGDLPGNGNTIAWRLGRVEKDLEGKADKDDVERIEGKLDKLILAALGAAASGIVAAILVAVQLSQT